MRSLRTAARTVVLVTLTGVAPGCGYDNPGFKLKDSDPDSDSAAQTTNVSGVTMMTTTETSPTSTSTSTTSEPMTTQGPGVSGSETSGSSVDPTTETPDTTTGKPQFEWPPCEIDETVPGPALPAVADTFLVHTGGQSSACFELENTDCKEQDFSGVKFLEVSYQSSDSEKQTDDFTSIFAVRFDAPPHPEVEGVMVPDMSVIGVRVTLHMARPVMPKVWTPPTFKVFPFHPDDAWQEGNAGDKQEACVTPGTSYHCRVCATKDVCVGATWSYNGYAYNNLEETTEELLVTLADAPKGEGVPVKFDFPVAAVDFLTKNGMLLIPDYVTESMIGVNTKESSNPPIIEFLYCPPEIIMP